MLNVKKNSGQTILELAFFMLWFVGFFVVVAYLFQVFEVSQKQTMLVRNQAFMELGNYSDYGSSQHGKDDPKNKESRVAFSLGKKAGATRVDLDKIETFKKATEGDLTIDVARSTNDDYYWKTYAFPKSKTKIVWFEGSTNQKNIEMDMMQVVGIAHNRNINMNQPIYAMDQRPTGLFSGSIQLEEFAKLANLSQKLQSQLGLVDDLEALRRASQQLIKDNPSLSDEAAKLEKSLNAADGLTGGLQAALISAAIQTATSFLMQAAGSALSKGGNAASQGGGKAVGSGAGQAAKQGATSTVVSKLTDPITNLQNLFNAHVISAPLGAVLAPISSVTSGLAGLTSGLSTGTFLSSGGALSGLSKMGQGVSMGASFGGVNIEGLNMATTLAGFPGALDSGISGFFGDQVNRNTWGYGDYVGAFSKIVAPVTGLVATLAPDLAAPISYINSGLAVASGIGSMADSASKFSAGEKLSDTLKNVGTFTIGVGALITGIEGFTGAKSSKGQWIMLAGGGLVATGVAMDVAEDLKKKGKSIWNPADTVSYMFDKNVENTKKTWNGFKTEMIASSDTIRTSTKNIMASKVNLTKDANADAAKQFMNGNAELTKQTMGTYDNMVAGVNKDDLSKANILRTQDDLDKMKAALVLNMKYQGVDNDKVEEVKKKFTEVQATIDHLDKVKSGQLAQLDPEILAKGNLAVGDLNRTVSQYLQQDPSKRDGFEFGSKVYEYAPDQVQAMLARNPNSQKNLELEALGKKETFQSQKKMENDLGSQGGWKGFVFNVKSVTGGDRTLEADRAQADKANELTVLANIKDANNKKIDNAKVAVRATQLSESISMYGPIATDRPEVVKLSAAKLSAILASASNDPIYSDEMRGRMKVQKDKLDAISKGEREFVSQREWLANAKEKVDDAAKEITKQKNIVTQNVADNCYANGGC
jgi:hypothetical protein